MSRWSGFLYKVAEHTQNLTREIILTCPTLKFEENVLMTGWEKYTYASPLAYHDIGPNELQGPFYYDVLIRRSGNRVLICSMKREIVTALVRQHMFPVGLKLFNQEIDIDELINSMVETPQSYSIGYTHANITSYGSALRGASLYGEDLANAKLFREHLDEFDFTTCGINNAETGHEIFRIGSHGGASFSFNVAYDLALIEEGLNYIKEQGHYL